MTSRGIGGCSINSTRLTERLRVATLDSRSAAIRERNARSWRPNRVFGRQHFSAERRRQSSRDLTPSIPAIVAETLPLCMVRLNELKPRAAFTIWACYGVEHVLRITLRAEGRGERPSRP